MIRQIKLLLYITDSPPLQVQPDLPSTSNETTPRGKSSCLSLFKKVNEGYGANSRKCFLFPVSDESRIPSTSIETRQCGRLRYLKVKGLVFIMKMKEENRVPFYFLILSNQL